MSQSAFEKSIKKILNSPDILPENREILTRFNKEADKNDGLSLTTRAIQLYRLFKLAKTVNKSFKMMTREDIEGLLKDLGYEYDEVVLELSLIEYNRQLKLRDILIDRLHEQYIDFIIGLTELHTLLDMFGFQTREIEQLQEEWDLERQYRTKRPPLSDLRRFFSNGLITLEQMLDELRGQGYHEKYIDLFRQTLTAE